jgi:hypothetical protein
MAMLSSHSIAITIIYIPIFGGLITSFNLLK